MGNTPTMDQIFAICPSLIMFSNVVASSDKEEKKKGAREKQKEKEK